MISKISAIVFTAALAAACYALAAGYGPAVYYDAYGSPPADRQAQTDDSAKPSNADIAKDKQASPLIQAQD